jgi:hypothetical protein
MKDEPAFPVESPDEVFACGTINKWKFNSGLTKREYFAGLAMMQEGHKKYQWDNRYTYDGNMKRWDKQLADQARLAIRKADALLKELEKNETD